jgi:S-adenosylmethionine:diacylglycerol 3-amino-3-carboxypropyl transferase
MVHSFSIEEKLMDHAVVEFRKAAARENRGRHGVQRRYSPALQAQAVAYWRARRHHGERLPVVAAALGVAHWSLQRWIKASKRHARFHPVQVVTPMPAASAPQLVIEFPAAGARVERLDVEAAAKLLALLQ